MGPDREERGASVSTVLPVQSSGAWQRYFGAIQGEGDEINLANGTTPHPWLLHFLPEEHSSEGVHDVRHPDNPQISVKYRLTARIIDPTLRLYVHDVRALLSQERIVNRISITQAAAQFEVSRRTLERWINDGRLHAMPDPQDGRQRLVDPQAVALLVRQMPKRRTQRPTITPCAELQLAVGPQPTKAGITDEDRYSLAIDKALLQAYHHDHRLAERLSIIGIPNLTLDELREGPLGHELRYLAVIAQGHAYADHRLVLTAIDSVLEVLFRPTAADDYDYLVPRAFWDTDLGQMLNRAKHHAYRRQDLVSVEEATKLLRVTTPTVYRWMEDRTLDFVRDDTNARTWIVRRDVDLLKRVATAMSKMAS